MPEDVFLDELEFYDLGDDVIELYKEKEGFLVERPMVLPEVDWQRNMWLFCEEPDSTKKARYILVVGLTILI